MKRSAPPSCRHQAGRRGVDGSAAAPGDRPWRPRRLLVLFAVAVLGCPSNNLARAACSNGLEGVESSSGGVCCVEACGLCGGEGCGSVEGLSDTDCCTGDIIEAGVVCGSGNVAPCIIDTSVTATLAPVPSPVASPSQAPTSAPSTSKPVSVSEAPTAAPQTPTTAPQLPVAPAPTGAPAAVAAPTAAPVVVAAATAAPVVVKVTNAPSTPTAAPVAVASPSVVVGVTTQPFVRSNCENGFPGWQSNDACCSEFCGQCGGEGCGILGSADCCYDNIINAGLVCGQDTQEAPCIIDDSVVTPTPAPLAQGETAPPTTVPPITAPVSPSPTVQPAEGDVSAAPATSPTGSPVVSRGLPTTAPMPGTSVTETPVAPGETLAPQGATSSPEGDMNIAPVQTDEETCSNDLPGYQHGVVCCPLACGQCGGSGCENIAGTAGASDCCSDIILAAGEKCDSTAIVPVVAPCIVGTVDEVANASGAINAATGLRTSGGVGGAASVIGVACAVAVAAATTARFTR